MKNSDESMIESGMSCCSTCGQVKPFLDFTTSTTTVNGRRSSCKLCQNASQRAKRVKIVREVLPHGLSRCRKCGEVKSYPEFKPCKAKTNGCSSQCRKCIKEYCADPVRAARKRAYDKIWQQENCRHPLILKCHAFPSDPSPTDAAYIAGLFDAEGTIFIAPQSTCYAPVAAFYNNDPELMRWFKGVAGGILGSSLRKDRIGSNYSKQYWIRYTNQKAVRRLCEVLRDYLVLKRPQCDLALKAIGSTVAEKALMREEMMALNQRQVIIQNPPHILPGDFLGTAPDQNAWAYFAGWVDGDGTISLVTQKLANVTYAWITVYCCKPEALLWLNDRFGGTVSFRTRQNENNKTIQEGRLQLCAETDVKFALEGLLSHLKCKKEQAELVLNALKNIPQDRESWRQCLHVLNAKGRFKENPSIKIEDGQDTQSGSDEVAAKIIAENPPPEQPEAWGDDEV